MKKPLEDEAFKRQTVKYIKETGQSGYRPGLQLNTPTSTTF